MVKRKIPMSREMGIVVAVVIGLLLGCANQAWSARVDRPPALTARVDDLPDPVAPYREIILKGGHVDFDLTSWVRFKEGQPRAEDRLPEALAADGQRFEHLNAFLALVLHQPEAKIRIAGFTDPHECKPSECIELSKRRAVMVRDLLISKRFPSQRIASTCWYGSDYILTGEDTQEERARNQRVEVSEVFSLDGGACE